MCLRNNLHAHTSLRCVLSFDCVKIVQAPLTESPLEVPIIGVTEGDDSPNSVRTIGEEMDSSCRAQIHFDLDVVSGLAWPSVSLHGGTHYLITAQLKQK